MTAAKEKLARLVEGFGKICVRADEVTKKSAGKIRGEVFLRGAASEGIGLFLDASESARVARRVRIDRQ